MVSVDFVPDSQPVVAASGRTLVGSAPSSPTAASTRIQDGARLNCGRAGQMASSSLAAAAPSMPASRSGDAGREVEVTGGWQLVVSRKGPRRPALAAPAFKPPPIPRWLFGRCCRCLFLGHRASVCRDPIRCSRCLQNGHKSRGCRNRWMPLSSLDSLALPPPPLPRPAAASGQALPPRSGRGWEVPSPSVAVPPPPAPGPRLLLPTSSTPPVMAVRPGDASLRPAEDFVVVPATPEMQAEAAVLSSNVVVAWLEGA